MIRLGDKTRARVRVGLLLGIAGLVLAGCENGETGSPGIGTVAGAAAGAGAGRLLFGNSAAGMLIGGVTAVGLPEDLPLWVDAAVMGRDRIVLGGGSRGAKLVAAPELLRALPNAEVVDALAVPVGVGGTR